MARKASPTLIGAFVLGAVALAVAGLVILGGGKMFRASQTWVAYFDESIKGLAIGAPVMFNGVKVGSVTDVKVVIDQNDLAISTPVFFSIEADRLSTPTGRKLVFRRGPEGGRILIERGLRAQLELQSLVTGQLAIQLDFHPDKPARLVGVAKGHPEMPTIPSTAERLSNTLEKLPVDQIATAALSAIEGIDRLVNNPDLKRTLAALPATIGSVQEVVRRVGLQVDGTLADVRKLVANVDGQIGPTLEAARETVRDVQTVVRRLDAEVVPVAKDTLQDARSLVRNVDSRVGPLAANLEKTLAAAATAMEDARKVLRTVDDTIGDGSPLQAELMVVLRDLSAAARSIRTLSDYMERHPESLVFGKSSAGGR